MCPGESSTERTPQPAQPLAKQESVLPPHPATSVNPARERSWRLWLSGAAFFACLAIGAGVVGDAKDGSSRTAAWAIASAIATALIRPLERDGD